MLIRPRCFFRFMFVPLVALLGSRVQGALPLVDHVPGDAVLYIGWAGADSQSAVYQGSDLSAFIDHSNLPELAKEYLPKYFDQLTQTGGDQASMDGLQKALPLLWRHPVAVYIANLTTGGDGTPDGDLTIICDAGPDAAELQSDLQTALKGMTHLHVQTRQSLVIVGLDRAGQTEPDSSLASNAAFTTAMQKLQASPAIAAYVDGTNLLAMLDQSASKNTHGAAEIWPKVRDALGISHAGTIAITAGFDDRQWRTQAMVDAPSPRTGLLAAIEPRPIDPALLARIPASAGSVSLYNLDLSRVYDTIGDAMAVTPPSDKIFHQVSGAATVVLGANLRRQILGPLGSQWVLYSDPNQAGPVLLNHPSNASTASDSMVSVIFGLVNEINSQVPGAGVNPVVTAVQSTVKHVDVTSAQSKVASPTVAVNDGILYCGLNADSVVSAATLPSVAGIGDLMHTAAFASAVKRSGIADLGSFAYCDLPTTAPRAYASFGPAAEKLKTMLKQFGIELPAISLPPVDQLQLSPALSGAWADNGGFYYQSISPFPLSTALLGDPQQTMVNEAAVSGLGAILMPALERARSQAMIVRR